MISKKITVFVALASLALTTMASATEYVYHMQLTSFGKIMPHSYLVISDGHGGLWPEGEGDTDSEGKFTIVSKYPIEKLNDMAINVYKKNDKGSVETDCYSLPVVEVKEHKNIVISMREIPSNASCVGA